MIAPFRFLSLIFFSASIVLAPASAAEITVFCDGPLSAAMNGIAGKFQSATGHTVKMTYATAPALNAKLKAGERPDILISLAHEIEEMAKHNQLAAVERDVARLKLGLAVRNGAAVPDIATLDAYKKTLLASDAILHNSLASGRAFARQLDVIGIGEQVRSKIVVIDGNAQLSALAKRTGNDVAAGLLPQLIASKEVRYVGALPPEAQVETPYAAGLFPDSKAADAAKAFLQYLASPDARSAMVSAGVR